MPAVATYSPTGDTYIDGVLGDVKWAVNSLTYSFPASGSYYGSKYGNDENVTKFGALNSFQQNAVHSAVHMVASVANLRFTEISETSIQHADLRFARSDKPSTAWAYFPSTAAEGGDVWFNNSSGYYNSPIKGNYAYATVLHEIGHALGLEHAHEHFVMPIARDSMEYTVMSYRSYGGASLTGGYTNETGGYAQSLMMYDIAGLQHMYGANFATNSGNTTYSWSQSTGEFFVNGVGQDAPVANRIFQTVWDGGGTDTYNFSSYTGSLTIDLRPGQWTTTAASQLATLQWDGSKTAVGNIANALLFKGDTRSLIENAIGGGGNDTLTGNQSDNLLEGGAGNDRLTGGAGNDVLNGGIGDDTAVFSGQRSSYSVALLSDGSLQVDDLRSGAPDGKDVFKNIEWFWFADKTYSSSEMAGNTAATVPESLTRYGAAADDKLYGGAGNDKLYGRDGNDLLSGAAGRDYLNGGAGRDAASYSSANAGLVADLLRASKNTGDAYRDSYASIENLTGSTYADSLRGDGAVNVIRGGTGNDSLHGRGGNDVLRGGESNDKLYGGAGADILFGDAGADIFVFSSIKDSLPGARDTIRDFISGVDKIDIRGIDANIGLSGNQAFTFIGGSAFSGKSGQLSFANGVLSGDINGDKAADFQINVAGVSLLGLTDFLL